MNKELSRFAARLRGDIFNHPLPIATFSFGELALELFALQCLHNPAYQKICVARNLTPETVKDWTQIPFVPTSAFKELELTSIPPEKRAAVFHSSGTTEQRAGRHFHCAESLAVYEASLWNWFEPNLFSNSALKIQNLKLFCLTPPLEKAPHSSLVHMFDTVRQRLGAPTNSFVGNSGADGSWILDLDAALSKLDNSTISTQHSTLILGTAFSIVHLLDYLAENNLSIQLPPGSRVMETGGYKNRSRTMPKEELHALITARLGVPRENIVCEYGMSELSSQAYDTEARGFGREVLGDDPTCPAPNAPRLFHFPPWARVQIISPETGCEVADGETGMIRVFDLANVFSVAAIQTEDLGVRRGEGFELIGRAQLAEPRGCSLMNA